MKRILAGAAIVMLSMPFSALATTGEEVYKQTCFPCHNFGIAGAPQLDDKDDWAPRIANGMGDLYESALNGKGAMPAKGGNRVLSDEEVKAAVDYMVEKSK